MKNFIASLFLFISFGLIAQDGTYSIKLTLISGKRSGWQWTADELTLKNHKLSSKVMKEKEHFGKAGFAVSIDGGDTISFSCLAENKGISLLNWDGKVSGKNIEGTVKWINGQGEQTYTFSGTLKK